MVTDLLDRADRRRLELPDARPTPAASSRRSARRIRRILEDHKDLGQCEGIGLVVPGMVDRAGACISFAPRLGWRDFPLRDLLAKRDRPAGAHRELRPRVRHRPGLGRAARGRPQQRLRLPLGLGRPRRRLRRQRRGASAAGTTWPASSATCRSTSTARRARAARTGCWEAYVSNLATLSRYFGREHLAAQADPAGDRVVHRRRPGRPRARRRRQGRRGAAVDGALPRPRPGVGRQRRRPGAHLPQRRDHRRLGPDRGDGAPGARRARAGAGRLEHRDHARPVARPSRGCAARRPWSRRRSSRRRRSDDEPDRPRREAAAGPMEGVVA